MHWTRATIILVTNPRFWWHVWQQGSKKHRISIRWPIVELWKVYYCGTENIEQMFYKQQFRHSRLLQCFQLLVMSTGSWKQNDILEQFQWIRNTESKVHEPAAILWSYSNLKCKQLIGCCSTWLVVFQLKMAENRPDELYKSRLASILMYRESFTADWQDSESFEGSQNSLGSQDREGWYPLRSDHTKL